MDHSALMVIECLGQQGYPEVLAAKSLCRSLRCDGRTWLMSRKLYRNRTPLMYAALTGNIARLEYLLHNDYDIDKQCSRGFTALHWAISGGHYDTVRLLLTRGSNMYLLTTKNFSALTLAITLHRHDLVQLLLDSGLHSFQGSINTALRLGLSDCALLLKSRGALPDTINVGPMISHKTSNSSLMWALTLDRESGLLYKHFCDDSTREIINYVRQDGTSALMLASFYNNTRAVTKLLELGANDCRRRDGLGPLLWAAKRGNLKTIKILFDSGFDLNVAHNARTPIYYAIKNNDVAMIKFLCVNGANVQRSLEHLLYEYKSESLDIARALVFYGATVRSQDIEKFLLYEPKLIELFLEKKLICPSFKIGSQSLLELALARGLSDLVNVLLEIFDTWPLETRSIIYKGCLCALIKNFDQFLLNGPGLLSFFSSHVDQEERTRAFHRALIEEKPAIVDIITSYGVNIDAAVSAGEGLHGLNGLEPLMLACEFNNPELVRILLKLGLSDVHNFYDFRTGNTRAGVSSFCDPRDPKGRECLVLLKEHGFRIF